MSDNFTQIFSLSLLAIVVSILISWMVLKLICMANQNFLRALYISSEKSTTNARLLGGLSISLALIGTISSMLAFFPKTFSPIEFKLLKASLVSISLVTLYGYIDDKFEIRVRFKLIMQLTSVFGFAFLFVQNTNLLHPVLTFAVTSIFGLALVNGTNLLDGLDTLMVKVGGVSSVAFLYLGIISQSTPTIIMSMGVLSSLSVFYFFNREPAKVYMGEIGGGMIGLIFFFQSSFVFSGLKTQMSSINAFALVCIAGSFPVCELGISFVRRIWGKKSPFRGDKLHLHYVLKNKFQLSATQASTKLSITGAAVLAFGFLLANSYNPLLAFAVTTLTILQLYTMVCYEEWRSCYQNESSENLFKVFEGKKVIILDSTTLGNLDVSINDEQKEDSIKKKSA